MNYVYLDSDWYPEAIVGYRTAGCDCCSTIKVPEEGQSLDKFLLELEERLKKEALGIHMLRAKLRNAGVDYKTLCYLIERYERDDDGSVQEFTSFEIELLEAFNRR